MLLNSVADDDDGVVREDDHDARAAIRAAGGALDADDRRRRRARQRTPPACSAAPLSATPRGCGARCSRAGCSSSSARATSTTCCTRSRATRRCCARTCIRWRPRPFKPAAARAQTLATRVAEQRRDIVVAFVKVDGLEEQLSKPTPSARRAPPRARRRRHRDETGSHAAATPTPSRTALLAHDLTVVQSCLDAAQGAIARHGGMLATICDRRQGRRHHLVLRPAGLRVRR